jgi:hypothetical protein
MQVLTVAIAVVKVVTFFTLQYAALDFTNEGIKVSVGFLFA